VLGFCLTFFKLPNCFSKVLTPFYIPKCSV
jgi:hypothetical protein